METDECIRTPAAVVVAASLKKRPPKKPKSISRLETELPSIFSFFLLGSPDEARTEAHQKACHKDRASAEHEVLLGAVGRLFRLTQDGVLAEVLPELVQHVGELVHG